MKICLPEGCGMFAKKIKKKKKNVQFMHLKKIIIINNV